jgi:uncharacterized membrane protein YfcA
MSAHAGSAALALITLLAATVNGAFGYGFSSITLPVALLFCTNRILNPALVLVEVGVNGHTLFVSRRSVPRVWKRTLPIMLGLLPGILVGSFLLFLVTPDRIKLLTYAALLPLILLQAGGVRRPIRSEAAVGIPFGTGVGLLYSVTTISGPPLALMLNNQGYVKQEFRAALGLIRFTESLVTATCYWFLGLYSVQSCLLMGTMAPSVIIGIPIGAYLIRRLDPETFRRSCMSFDALIAGYGLSKMLLQLRLADRFAAYGVFAAVICIDAYLLYLFFSRGQRTSGATRDSARLGPADP